MAFLRSFVSQQLLFYFQNIWIQWRMRRIVGLVKQIFAFWYLPAKKLHSSSTSPSRMTSILEHFPSAQELHPDGDQVYFMIRPFSFQTSMVLPFFKTMLTQSSWPSGMYINNSSFVRLPWKMVSYKSDRKWDAPLLDHSLEYKPKNNDSHIIHKYHRNSFASFNWLVFS